MVTVNWPAPTPLSRVTMEPGAGQPSGVGLEKTAEGSIRALRGASHHPNATHPEAGSMALCLPSQHPHGLPLLQVPLPQWKHCSLCILSHRKWGMRGDWLLPRCLHCKAAMIIDAQHSGGDPCPLPLSPPHPLSHWVEVMMDRLHLLDPLPSPQHSSPQTQPESVLLTLTARPRLGVPFSPSLPFGNSTCLPRLSSNTTSPRLSS